MAGSVNAASRRKPSGVSVSRRRRVRKLGESRAGFGRILVPLEGSELSERVLGHLETLAGPGAEIVSLRAVVSASHLAAGAGAAPAASVQDFVDLSEIGRHEPEAYLGQVATRLSELALRVRALVALDPAAQAILRTAGDLEANLIAMTTHGRGGLERLVFGSVADAVVRGSSVPVFLLPVGDRADEGGASSGEVL
jgi:nucleotide-binding universal stress UspA family protein